MPETHCLVCGGAGLAPHLDSLLKCPGCGFVTARTSGDLDARGLYEGDYFTGEEYLDYAADEAFFKRNFRKRLRHLRRFIPAGRLLEIGAAYGFFLDLAREHFETLGFEVNPDAVRHARETLRLDVRSDDFLLVESAALGASFDAVVLWDVIEHLDRPDRFLGRIAEVTRPGAILCLTTGDIGSRLARLRGRKWRMIHPPSHLHYFDRATIARLLDRHGFDTIDIRSIGVARSLHQILYSVCVLGLRMPRLYAFARRPIPAGWGVTLNTFDIMQVTARRR